MTLELPAEVKPITARLRARLNPRHFAGRTRSNDETEYLVFQYKAQFEQ